MIINIVHENYNNDIFLNKDNHHHLNKNDYIDKDDKNNDPKEIDLNNPIIFKRQNSKSSQSQ